MICLLCNHPNMKYVGRVLGLLHPDVPVEQQPVDTDMIELSVCPHCGTVAKIMKQYATRDARLLGTIWLYPNGVTFLQHPPRAPVGHPHHNTETKPHG